MKGPRIGQYIAVKFYDLAFEDDWSEDDELTETRWHDPDDPDRKGIHPLPVIRDEGYVLEWGKRVILKVTKSSAGGEMAWFLPRSVVIAWRPATPPKLPVTPIW